MILAPGFLDEVDRKARHLWHRLLALAAELPTVFEEARGAGLMLGLKCAVPNGEVQDAFTAEGLLTVAAGDNVRAPGAAAGHHRRRHRRRDRDDAPRRAPLPAVPKAGGGEVSGAALRRTLTPAAPARARSAPRHFLELRDFDAATLRHMLDIASGFKAAAASPPGRCAGKTLALIFEKPSTRTRVSFEVADAPARRRRDRADGQRRRSSAAARRWRTPRACCRATWTRSCCAPTRRETCTRWRPCDRPGHQRADGQRAIPASSWPTC